MSLLYNFYFCIFLLNIQFYVCICEFIKFISYIGKICTKITDIFYINKQYLYYMSIEIYSSIWLCHR